MKKRKFNLTQLGGWYMTPRVVMKSDKIGSPAKKVLCYIMTLWTCTDDIHPSVTTIADITDQSERSVKYAIKELTKKGLIKVVQRGNGYGHSNSYAVNVTGINKFFDCEILIDETKKEEPKKETAPQVNNQGRKTTDTDEYCIMLAKQNLERLLGDNNKTPEPAREWEPL